MDFIIQLLEKEKKVQLNLAERAFYNNDYKAEDEATKNIRYIENVLNLLRVLIDWR